MIIIQVYYIIIILEEEKILVYTVFRNNVSIIIDKYNVLSVTYVLC